MYKTVSRALCIGWDQARANLASGTWEKCFKLEKPSNLDFACVQK